MTKEKDLKRLIRARMEKTGEAYTAARAHIVAKRSPPTAEYASLAGMSDEALSTKTGHTWAEWVDDLDAIEAITMSHRDIAKYVKDNNTFSGWWAQTVAVGYERIRGLRKMGQQREGQFAGLYEISKSKTLPVSVGRLFEAFHSKSLRGHWLAEPDVEVRTSKVNRSIGFNWPDGTKVNCWFTEKASNKSSVQVAHIALPSAEIGEVVREQWAERLNAVAELLQDS